MNIHECVGTPFNKTDLEKAQARTWLVLNRLAEQICVGMTEDEAHQKAKELFKEFGAEKQWHPSKIRFAQNTLKSFREISEPGVSLQLGDPFFLDIGPVFFGHEGDCGKSFVLGQNPEAQAMIQAGEEVFAEVKNHWSQNKVTGNELYHFAETSAKNRGYELNLKGASGHRIGDFPHAVHHKGSLKDFSAHPIPDRWILEIQLKHPKLAIGAFYEDLL